MKISVVTINYNNAAGLEQTIPSVVGQSYPELEYIVIDGGSKDESKSVIERYHDKITYWVSEKDGGIYNAMNKGIRKATGDYLIFINSGDTFASERVLEELMKDVGTEHDLIYGDLKMVYPGGKSHIDRMPEKVTMETMINGTLYHPVSLIKRQLFEQFGLYDERLKIVSDWAFFLKIIAFGNIRQVHKSVVVADFMVDGISSSNHQMIDEEKTLIKKELFSDNMLQALEEYGKVVRFYYYPGMSSLRKLIAVLRKIKNKLKN